MDEETRWNWHFDFILEGATKEQAKILDEQIDIWCENNGLARGGYYMFRPITIDDLERSDATV